MLSKAKGTIRVLLLAANPSDTAALRLAEEARDIQDVLDRAEVSFQVRHITAVRPRDIPRKLRTFRPNFVHFCGHGEVQGIILEDSTGCASIVSKEALGSLFSLLRGVKCVFLNSCYSSSQAEEIVSHVPYVIAMREAISDVAAMEFAFGFYQAVGDGVNIPAAFEYGKTALMLACGLAEANIPVLFRRKPRERSRRYSSGVEALDNALPDEFQPIMGKADDAREPVNLRLLGRRTEPIFASFPPDVWSALKLKTSYVPKHIRLKTQIPTRRSSSTVQPTQFQVFEVLFTEILSLMQPSFEWEVTPIQGDRGIDFRGSKELFSVPDLQISAHLMVCGQCKIRSARSRPLDLLSSDVEKLLYGVRTGEQRGAQNYPSYVIFALASVTTSRSLENAARVFMDNHHVPLYIFGLREIDYLLRHNIQALSTTISECLPPEAAKSFVAYFSEQKSSASLDIDVSISKPARVLAGESFTVIISVAHFLLPTKQFFLRLESSSGESLDSAGPQSKSTVLVVGPLTTVTKSGMSVGGKGHFTQTVHLRLVTYSTGEVDLGVLSVESQEGQDYRVSLGVLDVVDTYTPPFYWQPYLDYWGRFNDFFTQATSGVGKLIACLGSGGAGKTRLCQELCIRAEQLGGVSVSVAHQSGLAQPYKILRDLLCALSPQDLSNNLDSSSKVMQSVRQLSPALYSETKGSLATCLEMTKAGELTPLNAQDISRVLAALLIVRASTAVTVVHLSNLHWCHPEILRLLRSVAQEANTHLKAFGNACIFLFEGRTGHAQTTVRVGEDREVWSTIAFEDFANGCDCCIKLKPLSDSDSEGFLRNMIEHSQSSHRKVSLTMIPHQEELLRQVLTSARGNPQHIVEQLNLLRHKGVVGRNERTGLLYLVQPSGGYEPPTDVLELIESRFSYYRVHHPPLASLIRATALVDDRIDKQLFDLLKAYFAPEYSLRQIEECEFLLLPDRLGTEVSFRHENYFYVITQEAMRSDHRREAVDLYVKYVDSLSRQNATLLLLRSRALLTDPSRSWEEARQSLVVAQSLATKAREEHVELRVLEALAPLSAAGESDPLRLFLLRQRLAELRLTIGDRQRSAELLRAALRELEDKTRSSPAADRATGKAEKTKLFETLLSGRILLANVNLNIFEIDESIAILESSLRDLADGHRSPVSRDHKSRRAQILNRLAVAYAIAGRNYEATSTAALSVSLARESRNKGALYSCLVDYGNIVAPTAIETGLVALEEALALARPSKISVQQLLIGRIHLTALRLVWILHHAPDDSEDRSVGYRCIQGELVKIYTEARSQNLIQEAGAAALLCGDTAILLGDSSVVTWFLEAIEWSFRGNHLEILWRAHLNLAQFLLEGPEDGREGALHHAEHALRLLGSLNSRTGRTQVALAQVARVFWAAGDSRGQDLINAYPSLRSITVNNSERGILEAFHFGASAYFLY